MAQFIAAQGSGIEGSDDGPMLQVAGSVEYARDLLRAQHGRQLEPPLGNSNLDGYFLRPAIRERNHTRRLRSGGQSALRAPTMASELVPKAYMYKARRLNRDRQA